MRGGRERVDSGMVSAELAVGLVTLLLVLSLVLGVVRIGLDRVAAVSVAGTIAREAARGGDVSGTWARSREALPPGATYAVRDSGGFVTVAVRAPARAGLVGLVLPDPGPVEAVARVEGEP